jgi:hypothetical protein
MARADQERKEGGMSRTVARDVRVQVGTDMVSVHTGSRGGTQVAAILGREKEGEIERIYLDRRVHENGESVLGDWTVRGAISSILERHHSTHLET